MSGLSNNPAQNTAINKEWYQNVLKEQFLPTTLEQFGGDLCIFHLDGAPCHRTRMIMKRLGDL